MPNILCINPICFVIRKYTDKSIHKRSKQTQCWLSKYLANRIIKFICQKSTMQFAIYSIGTCQINFNVCLLQNWWIGLHKDIYQFYVQQIVHAIGKQGTSSVSCLVWKIFIFHSYHVLVSALSVAKYIGECTETIKKFLEVEDSLVEIY